MISPSSPPRSRRSLLWKSKGSFAAAAASLPQRATYYDSIHSAIPALILIHQPPTATQFSADSLTPKLFPYDNQTILTACHFYLVKIRKTGGFFNRTLTRRRSRNPEFAFCLWSGPDLTTRTRPAALLTSSAVAALTLSRTYIFGYREVLYDLSLSLRLCACVRVCITLAHPLSLSIYPKVEPPQREGSQTAHDPLLAS